MYTVSVRDHIMIAHSLPDPFFGPAANMHGATYVISAEFRAAELNPHNVVIDIGLASGLLHEVASELNYKNLDEVPAFRGVLTTTEFLAGFLHRQLVERLRTSQPSFRGSLRVTLGESHVASASYEGPVI